MCFADSDSVSYVRSGTEAAKFLRCIGGTAANNVLQMPRLGAEYVGASLACRHVLPDYSPRRPAGLRTVTSRLQGSSCLNESAACREVVGITPHLTPFSTRVRQCSGDAQYEIVASLCGKSCCKNEIASSYFTQHRNASGYLHHHSVQWTNARPREGCQ